MFDFGALPPEINSGRMYAGPGAESIMVAATAWDELAAELGAATSGYNSVITELTSAPWVGPSSTAMVSAVAPYVSWLGAAAGLAEDSASQARAAAGAFEAAFAMTVPPPVIVANRVLLATLVATNFFGQNTPAIMATEAQYMEMWAQDAAAMYGYAASSAAATVLTPYQSPPNTSTPDAVAQQGAAAAQAAAQPAGTSAQTVTQLLSQIASIPQTLQQLALQQLSSYTFTNWPFSMLQSQFQDFLKYGLPTPTNDWFGIRANGLAFPATGISPLYNEGRQFLQAYFGVGLGNFGWGDWTADVIRPRWNNGRCEWCLVPDATVRRAAPGAVGAAWVARTPPARCRRARARPAGSGCCRFRRIGPTRRRRQPSSAPCPKRPSRATPVRQPYPGTPCCGAYRPGP